eukprot:gene11107-11261_t
MSNQGHGTALVDDHLVATLCGVVQRINKLIYVQPVKSRYQPEIGDVVVGRVTERRRNAEDELNMRNMFREGDLISAEVQSKGQDGSIQLHTRSVKFGKLTGGQLVIIDSKLVKKQRFHFTTLKGLDVDVISGLNGLIWVSPHIPRGEDGAPLQVYPEAIMRAYQASVEAGVAVKDMTGRKFLEVLAQQEVTRRHKETAAQVSGMELGA